VKRIQGFIALGAIAVFLAAPARAEDVLKLKDGTVLRGRATAYDESTETATFVTGDGRERKLPLDQLDRLSAYKIAKTRAPASDAQGQLKIANFARDAELYLYAVRHYENARKADPALAPTIERELGVLRREAADYCMRNANAALEKKEASEAEKWLTTLVQKLPGEPQAAQASSMLEDLYAKNHGARDDELEQKDPDLLKTELADGKRYYDAMLEKIRKGLANSRSTSVSKGLFEQAWNDGEKALRELDKVQKGHGDAETAELFDGYRRLVREHMVDAQLNIASMLTTSTNYRGALAAANKALSIDPESQVARQARARIEVAASESSLFGW
jgi:hypothetical protein